MVQLGNIARHALPPLITSAFLSCDSPLPTTLPQTPEDIAAIQSGLALGSLFTTTYEVVLPAACPTSAWTATYTISQVCSGEPSAWTIPSVLPNFDVTTVICDVCEEATQTITCPNALGTEPAVINGNGVTMTAVPTREAGAVEYGKGYAPGEGGKHAFGPGGTEGGHNWGAPQGGDGKAPVVTAGADGLRVKAAVVVSGLVALVGGLFVL
ncbi:hypothetical protein V8F20_000907 [Naviculisporaceae sp. PSN 640]